MAKASKFLVVPDKFRGSLSASQASHAIKMGILAANKDAHVVEFSMTDGGDAFVDTIAKAKKGEKKKYRAVISGMGFYVQRMNMEKTKNENKG